MKNKIFRKQKQNKNKKTEKFGDNFWMTQHTKECDATGVSVSVCVFVCVRWAVVVAQMQLTRTSSKISAASTASFETSVSTDCCGRLCSQRFAHLSRARRASRMARHAGGVWCAWCRTQSGLDWETCLLVTWFGKLRSSSRDFLFSNAARQLSQRRRRTTNAIYRCATISQWAWACSIWTTIVKSMSSASRRFSASTSLARASTAPPRRLPRSPPGPRLVRCRTNLVSRSCSCRTHMQCVTHRPCAARRGARRWCVCADRARPPLCAALVDALGTSSHCSTLRRPSNLQRCALGACGGARAERLGRCRGALALGGVGWGVRLQRRRTRVARHERFGRCRRVCLVLHRLHCPFQIEPLWKDSH